MRLRIWIPTFLLLLICSFVFADGLDLPITDPRLQKKVAGPPPPPEPLEYLDPTDEPPIFYGEEIDLEDDSLIFVIDGSGSMSFPANGAQRGRMAGELSRWDVVKAELKKSINAMSENIEFNIVKYACDIVFWSDTMKPANEANKASASAWLDRFVHGRTAWDGIHGGTGTGPAVAAALGVKDNLNIVLLTDGEPNCPWGHDSFNEHRNAIRINNTQGAVIDVFGVVASGQHRAFCQAVAADSGGSYYDR